MTAMRCATWACWSGGRPESSSEALSGVMWASTSAMTCGCSSTMKERSWGEVGLVQELERHLDRGRVQPLHDLRRASLPSDCSSRLLGVVQTAPADRAARGQHVGGLLDDGLGLGDGHRLEPGDLAHDGLDLGLAEVVEDLGGLLPAQAHQQDRRLAGAQGGEGGRCSSRLHQPTAQQGGDVLGLTLDERVELVLHRVLRDSSASPGRGRRRAPARRRGPGRPSGCSTTYDVACARALARRRARIQAGSRMSSTPPAMPALRIMSAAGRGGLGRLGGGELLGGGLLEAAVEGHRGDLDGAGAPGDGGDLRLDHRRVDVAGRVGVEHDADVVPP